MAEPRMQILYSVGYRNPADGKIWAKENLYLDDAEREASRLPALGYQPLIKRQAINLPEGEWTEFTGKAVD